MVKVMKQSTRRKHPDGFRWVNESFGTNWRMTEMQGVNWQNTVKKNARLAY